MRILGIVLILCFGVLSCEFSKSAEPTNLPSDAINVQELGNGWVQFDLGAETFLYHKSFSGNQGYESLTVIP